MKSPLFISDHQGKRLEVTPINAGQGLFDDNDSVTKSRVVTLVVPGLSQTISVAWGPGVMARLSG